MSSFTKSKKGVAATIPLALILFEQKLPRLPLCKGTPNGANLLGEEITSGPYPKFKQTVLIEREAFHWLPKKPKLTYLN
jgi:hypothetical protein